MSGDAGVSTLGGVCGLAQQPPSNDMGVENTLRAGHHFWSIHNVSGTFRGKKLSQVLSLLTFVLVGFKLDATSVWDSLPNGGRGYDHIKVGPNGSKIYYSANRDDIHFELPGQACELAGIKPLLRLFRHTEMRFTRVDSALDVPFEDCPSISELHQMALATFGNHQQAPTARYIRTHARKWKVWMSDEGNSLYIGASDSEVQLRIYDQRGFMRFELQTRGDTAALVQGWHRTGRHWARLKGDWNAESLKGWCLGLLRNYVEFVEPESQDSNISRAAHQSWWSNLVGRFDKARAELDETDAEREERLDREAQRAVGKKRHWINHQVGPSLAMLHKLSVELGDGSFWDFIHSAVNEGYNRLRGNHRLALQQALITPQQRDARQGYYSGNMEPVFG